MFDSQACELHKQLRQLIYQISAVKMDGSSRLVLRAMLAKTFIKRDGIEFK